MNTVFVLLATALGGLLGGERPGGALRIASDRFGLRSPGSPPGASGSFWEPLGAPRELLGASGRFPEASGSFPGASGSSLDALGTSKNQEKQKEFLGFRENRDF